MEFKGHYITSDVCNGIDGKYLAWDQMLEGLVDLVRRCPSSRFVWRKEPEVFEDADFASSVVQFRADCRVTEVIGDGELPHRKALVYCNEDLISGFGLGVKHG